MELVDAVEVIEVVRVGPPSAPYIRNICNLFSRCCYGLIVNVVRWAQQYITAVEANAIYNCSCVQNMEGRRGCHVI